MKFEAEADQCAENEAHVQGPDVCLFVLTDHQVTGEDAAQTCQEAGYSLADIKDQSLEDGAARAVELATSCKDSNWIGLSDKDEEGRFVWGDGSNLTFSDWATNFPLPDTTEPTQVAMDCVAHVTLADGWVNAPCDEGPAATEDLVGTLTSFCSLCRAAPTTCTENLGWPLGTRTYSCCNHQSTWLPFSDWCYAQITQLTTWNEGRQKCRDIGSGWDLASYTSQDILLLNLATATLENIECGKGAWIGLNDRDTEGTFRWVDGSSSSLRRWASYSDIQFPLADMDVPPLALDYVLRTSSDGWVNVIGDGWPDGLENPAGLELKLCPMCQRSPSNESSSR